MAGYDQSVIQAEISGLKVEVKGLSGKVEKIEDALLVLTRLEVEREHQKEANNLIWTAIRELQSEYSELREQSNKNTFIVGSWMKVVGWFVTSGGLGAVLMWWYTKK